MALRSVRAVQPRRMRAPVNQTLTPYSVTRANAKGIYGAERRHVATAQQLLLPKALLPPVIGASMRRHAMPLLPAHLCSLARAMRGRVL